MNKLFTTIDRELTRTDNWKTVIGAVISLIIISLLVYYNGKDIYREITHGPQPIRVEQSNYSCEFYKQHIRSCSSKTGDAYVNCLALFDAPEGCN